MDIKAHFDLGEDIHYLNAAYMTPQPRSVQEIGERSLRRKQFPHTMKPEEFFTESDKLREVFSRLINNDDPQKIAIFPSVSYGMSVVARNLRIKAGQKIVIAADQFPSNVYPWMWVAERMGAELCVVEPPDDLQNRGKVWNQRILDAIDSQTALVALSVVHWADGTYFDPITIRERSQEHNAFYVLDATQSIGALPFDIKEIQADAVVCATYKWMFGPYGQAIGYFGEAFEYGEPIEEGWINREESDDFQHLTRYNRELRRGGQRFDAGGRSNFITVPMATEGIRLCMDFEPKHIQEHCRVLWSKVIPELKEKGFWVESEDYRADHLVGIRHPELDINKAKEALAEAKVIASFRGDCLRVSPHLYNNEADMQALLGVLSEL